MGEEREEIDTGEKINRRKQFRENEKTEETCFGEGGRGKGQKEGKREDCRRYATCLVVQAWTTFTLDLQCIQRVQTGFINPLDHSPRTCTPDICVFPTSCFLDVQLEATRLYTCNRSLARCHCYSFSFSFSSSSSPSSSSSSSPSTFAS